MNTLPIITRSNKCCSGSKKKKKKVWEEMAFSECTLLTFDDLFFLLAVFSERSSTSDNANSEVWFQNT